VTGEPKILENIFVCDGEPGHEIVYLFPCRFMDQSYYERKIIKLVEANGSHWDALWVKIEDCLNGTIRLVPETLLEWYKTHSGSVH
jgi:hypothetical protein